MMLAYSPAVYGIALLTAMLLTSRPLGAQTSEQKILFPFQKHLLNAESEFSAAAVMDVDRDGLLDIVCGAYWYKAPHWTKNRFRDVEQIRGRYDDYANLSIDVDGDGLPDIVSVNYRSQSLFWCQNPGSLFHYPQDEAPATEQAPRPSAIWKKTLIDRPGKSETGRLVDIDGDGQLDILPAGTDFAAWYEVIRNGQSLEWRRHDLPSNLIGHGIGWGDINGNGRLDLFGPNGWAESPPNARDGRWKWHPDFQLPRDCSIPILCHDVNGDGRNDLIWSRGHHIGIYWTEQLNAGQLSWKLDSSIPRDHTVIERICTAGWITHAIDTSWGSAHTLLLADLTGDGNPDLVAGKRYQGHDGKDPGENDPLRIYSYHFDSHRKTWARNPISFGGNCGIDLDAVCVDLDGDGDIDIVAPSRSGLYWLENLACRSTDNHHPQRTYHPEAPTYEDHLDLNYYLDLMGNRIPLKNALDHGIRRWHILEAMQSVMGQLPDSSRRTPLDAEVHSIEKAEAYWRLLISFNSDGMDRVPAYLLLPFDYDKPAPAMLCLHQTQFALGKGEPCGLGGNPSLHYAHELASQGYVCLAPDYPGFGDYSYSFEDHSQQYESGTMKGIWNHLRAIDLLESLPCVNRDAMGVIGHSLGGHNALFVAAMDQRISCVVTSCGFTSLADYYGGDLTGWTSARYMPKIATEFGNSPGRMPFDFPQILAAIAPRPIFVSAPLNDSNFAVKGVRRCEVAVQPIYDILGATEKMTFVYPDAEHDFPAAQREHAYRWLREVLR
jgi:dienelactone hydrolase